MLHLRMKHQFSNSLFRFANIRLSLRNPYQVSFVLFNFIINTNKKNLEATPMNPQTHVCKSSHRKIYCKLFFTSSKFEFFSFPTFYSNLLNFMTFWKIWRFKSGAERQQERDRAERNKFCFSLILKTLFSCVIIYQTFMSKEKGARRHHEKGGKKTCGNKNQYDCFDLPLLLLPLDLSLFLHRHLKVFLLPVSHGKKTKL